MAGHHKAIRRGRWRPWQRIAKPPLPAQRLSAELLPRAAARAGLQGRWLRRSLAQIPPIALPALLELHDGRSAILLGWSADGQARLMLSESEGGEVLVAYRPRVETIIKVLESSKDVDCAWSTICKAFDLKT